MGSIGLNWERVYRTGDAFQYQVLAGDARTGGSPLSFDEPASVGGPFEYLAPIADDPSLGSDFDYPSWIRVHVTW